MISGYYDRRIYPLIIRAIRTRQDWFRRQMALHQEVYNDLDDERSFRALYHSLVIVITKELYWFCVANARYRDWR